MSKSFMRTECGVMCLIVSWHRNFDTQPHFVGEIWLNCELLYHSQLRCVQNFIFLLNHPLSSTFDWLLLMIFFSISLCESSPSLPRRSRELKPKTVALRNAFNYSTMYFQINGLSDTQSAGLSTMFQLACAIGNVLGGFSRISRERSRGPIAASHTGWHLSSWWFHEYHTW